MASNKKPKKPPGFLFTREQQSRVFWTSSSPSKSSHFSELKVCLRGGWKAKTQRKSCVYIKRKISHVRADWTRPRTSGSLAWSAFSVVPGLRGSANGAWARTVQTRTVFVWEHKEGFLTPLNPSPVFSAMKLIRPSCGCLFCQRPELDAVSLWLLTGFSRKDTEQRFFCFYCFVLVLTSEGCFVFNLFLLRFFSLWIPICSLSEKIRVWNVK